MKQESKIAPQVSIIVPVYNIERYLKRCMESILKQTFRNFEVILVNDGSQDTSGMMCDEYAEIDARIKVIHKKNGGLSSARNTGMDAASGDYVMFVDGDDYIEPNMVDSQYALAKQYVADIVCCGFYTDIEGKTHASQEIERTVHVCVWEDVAKGVLSGELLYTSFCNKLYSRTLLPHLRNNESIYFTEDRLANYHAMKQANRIVVSDNTRLYHYQIRRDSLVQDSLSERQFSALNASDMLMKMECNNPMHLPYCRRQRNVILMTLITRIIKSNRFWERYPQMRKELLQDFRVVMDSDLYSRKEKLTTWLLKYCPMTYRAIVRGWCIYKRWVQA